MKRIFDIVFSILALLICAPLFLVIALIIKVQSDGPIFFKQERVGQFCSIFEIIKFRTMTVDAEKNGIQITFNNDPRVTTLGKFLRKYKLDELPQFWNVLRGDMSVVGPRPEVSKFVDHYPPELKDKIFSIKPGITDLGSIHFSSESSYLISEDDANIFYVNNILPIKISYYVDYINNKSLMLDIKIIFLTFKKIILGNKF
jgi:lipopolysaccharide/colanic/teichoic acid biosynthesis glycosyltransferase